MAKRQRSHLNLGSNDDSDFTPLKPTAKGSARPSAKRVKLEDDDARSAEGESWRQQAMQSLQYMSHETWLEEEIDRMLGHQLRWFGPLDSEVLLSLMQLPIDSQHAAVMAASGSDDFEELLRSSLAAVGTKQEEPAQTKRIRPSQAKSVSSVPKQPATPPPTRQKYGSDGWARQGHRRMPEEEERAFIETFVPVPLSMISKIIGKKGSNITAMKKESQAHVIDARNQDSDPVPVRVVGTPEAVEKAEMLIHALMDSVTSKYTDAPPAMEVPRKQVGLVMGQKGNNLNRIQRESDAKVDLDMSCDPCKIFIKGSEEQIDRAMYLIKASIGSLEDQPWQMLEFPLEYSGAILGKQGARIRNIQEQSLAFLDVDKSSGTCQVKIRGDPEAIEKASELLYEELAAQQLM